MSQTMSTSVPKTLQQLLEERQKIDAAILSMGGKVSEKKEKAKRVGVKGAWSEWTTKVLSENKDAVKAFTAAQEKKVGAHLKWLSANFGKTSSEWLAFQAEWKVAHPKEEKEEKEESDAASASGSASGSASTGKRRGPKKLEEMNAEERAEHDAKVAKRKVEREALTPEQKAAKKAEAAAKKAKKEAKEPAPSAPVAAPVEKPKEVPILPSSPAPVAAPAPKKVEEDAVSMKTADEEDVVYELLPFKLGNTTYLRLGAKSEEGEPEWAEGGDLWNIKKGVKSFYAGALQEDGSIDTDADEPDTHE